MKDYCNHDPGELCNLCAVIASRDPTIEGMMNPAKELREDEPADRASSRCPACPGICKDHDDECVFVTDVLSCYLYQPERGICPLLAGGKN